MLDRLVLADRTIEHDAAFRIIRGTRQRHLAEPDRFGGDQDALRVHAVQDVFEAAALLAKTVFHRDLKILEEQFIGVDGLAAHLLDLVHGDARSIEIGIEQAEAAGRVLHLFQRRGPRQQQYLVGDLSGGDPDLLAVDDVVVALPLRAGLQLRGIQPRVRFGDGKAGFFGAGDDRRQHPAALLVGAEHHHRVEPENIHVHG
jgi:hypothetical protein